VRPAAATGGGGAGEAAGAAACGARAGAGSTRGGGGLGRSEALERLPNMNYALLRPLRNDRKGSTLLLSSACGVRPVRISARRQTASDDPALAFTSMSI
jgi:hypothetical protein